ncbi:unnamed protein product [Rhizophagus irregularis]|uniref:Uncharacterized protein n=1 Tax=Rhizophagus irregularis TaxID=588596 RepID=A0A2N1NXP6_9GLOM|nr:hypothetical protein RhiirC2_870186 [Rhizophagus irregularis]PKK78646.1 hypothetical protein RhiirC2_861094 [Rhizophagus irregularis]CAB5387044.1 unnamed protein product [Rhizophagus irregularis]
MTPVTPAIDTIAPPINDIPIPSEEGKTWHPVLGIFIEDELFPYIPTGHLYKRNKKGRIHHTLLPGSEPWIEAVRDLRLNALRENAAKDAADKAARQHREKARLWNTSENRLHHRVDKVNCLTEFQYHYHRSINELIDSRADINDKLNKGIKKGKGKMTKKLQRLEQELVKFNIDYHSQRFLVKKYRRYEGETSDGAKELEIRPHKRTTHHHIDSHLNHDKPRDSIKHIKITHLPDLFVNSNEGGMPSSSH